MRLESFLLLLLMPATCLICHRFFLFFPQIKNAARTKGVLIALGGAIFLTGTLIFLLENKTGLSLAAVLLVLFSLPLLGHLYFQVFNLSETARRINILVTLKKKGTFASNTHYAPEDLIRVRLERLRELNQVEVKDGVYESKNTLLTFVAVTLRTLERVFYPHRS